MALKVGDIAPDFELPAVEGEQRTKSQAQRFPRQEKCSCDFSSLELDPDLRRATAGVRLGSREVRRAQCPGSGHKH